MHDEQPDTIRRGAEVEELDRRRPRRLRRGAPRRGRRRPLDPMRHSAAHVMAEAVLDLFPGTKLGIGPPSPMASTTTSPCPAPLTPDDLEAIEARMAQSVDADHPFVRASSRSTRPRARRGRGPALQGRDPRRSAREGRGSRRAAPDHDLLRARPVHRPMPRPARREHGQARPVQAPHPSPARTGAATSIARRSSASTARSGRRRRSSITTCGAEEAKKRDHRRLGVQLDLFIFHDVSPGAAFWHPKGWTLYHMLAMRCASCRSDAATRRSTRRRSSARGCGSSRGTGSSTATTCSWSRPTADLQPEADELPRIDVRLQARTRAPTATCRCASPSTACCTATSSRACSSGLTRVRHFVTDDGHVFVRPDQIGAEIEALLDDIREAYSWFGLCPR